MLEDCRDAAEVECLLVDKQAAALTLEVLPAPRGGFLGLFDIGVGVDARRLD